MSEILKSEAIISGEYFGLPMACAEEKGFSADRLSDLAATMKAVIDEGWVPGILSAVAREGSVVHIQAQGYADQASKTALRTDTLFRIYSMTKPITAVAMMLLAERGQLQLDDPLVDYLPAFNKMMIYTDGHLVPAENPITLRQLLLHTSGLTYSMLPNEPAVSSLYEAAKINEARGRLGTRNLKAHVDALAEQPLIAEPGTAWHYCEGVSVAARVIEILSGQSYGDFLHDHIFEPLGMIDTFYSVPPEKRHRLATLYEQQAASSENLQPEYKPSTDYGGDYLKQPTLQAGGAGLLSTASDYLRFAQMLLNGGELDGKRLLNDASVQCIMENQLGPEFGPSPLETLAPKYQGLGFGLCGYVVSDGASVGRPGTSGQYGWSGWANTHFWIDPNLKLVGLVMTQLIPRPEIDFNLAATMRKATYDALENERVKEESC